MTYPDNILPVAEDDQQDHDRQENIYLPLFGIEEKGEE